MKFSLNALSEWFESSLTPANLAERLTQGGFEVEAILSNRAALAHTYVVEVLHCAPHPSADRLQIVTISTGAEQHVVVSGAPDIRVGQLTVWAQPGAVLPAKQVQSIDIRGVTSHGMLCSEHDLGVTNEQGGLCDATPLGRVGTCLVDTFLADTFFEVGVTPNRPDAMCHMGLAREIVALAKARPRRPRVVFQEKAADVGERVAIEIADTQGCRRYIARAASEVKIAMSPLWLRARLFSLGVMPIHNVVDITQWVMLEMGQPLHVFDLEKLAVWQGKQHKLTVRRATIAESLKLLNQQDVTLTAQDLVIADARGAVALAGVMGGQESAVTAATSHILLESAWFESQAVYQTAKRHHLMTDAANRFWRGVDIEAIAGASERACQLLVELCGAVISRGEIDLSPKKRSSPEVSLATNKLKSYMGISLPKEEIAQHLSSIGLTLKSSNSESLLFEIPSYRADLVADVDLIEEVVRLYGYQHIPERLPGKGGAYQSATPVSDFERVGSLRQLLASSGFREVIHYAFIAPEEEAPFRPCGVTEPVTLMNPMSADQSVMRDSLLPGLVKNLHHHAAHGITDLRLFELGRVFYPRTSQEPAASVYDQALPCEELRLGLLLTGAAEQGWGVAQRESDFYDLKSLLTHICTQFGAAPLRYETTHLPGWLHPYAAASLWQGEGDQQRCVGFAGQLHPQALESSAPPVWVIDCEVQWILEAALHATRRYQPLNRFPSMRRDLALVLGCEQPIGPLMDFMRDYWATHQHEGCVLEDLQLFDVYQGPHVPNGHLSAAFAFTFRHPERTLQEKEVQTSFDALVAALTQNFVVQLRA